MPRLVRLAWVGVLFGGLPAPVIADGTLSGAYFGAFAVPLESGWSWSREEPKGWKVDDGSLLILTLPGHVFAKYNDARNVLLRSAPDAAQPWSVEVFVESRPRTQVEEATLYWVRGVVRVFPSVGILTGVASCALAERSCR